MTSPQPKWFPTFRTFYGINDLEIQQEYERLAFIVKQYRFPVTKVSDGQNWIRMYFDVPLDQLDEFLGVEAKMKRPTMIEIIKERKL